MSSATFDAGSSLIGNILADTSITLAAGASLSGKAFARTAEVTLSSNNVSACVTPPTVTVTKVSNGGVGTFSFTGDNGFANQNITTVTDGLGVVGAPQTLTAPAVSTTITESALPAGFALTSIVCTGMGAGGTAVQDLVTRTVTLDAAATVAGAAISCTFTNTQQGGITVVKNTVGGDGSFDFTSATLTPSPFTLTTVANTAQMAFGNLDPGTFDVAETVPAGWTLTDSSCSDGSPVNAIDLAAGENVVCVFNNSQDVGAVPTLNQYALGLMALLMLGLGLVGFRRFI